MFSNETKEFIRLYLKDLFNKNELENGITDLESYLDYIESKYNDSFNNIISEFSVSNLFQQKTSIKLFTDIEHFLGLLADVLQLKDESKNVPLPSDKRRGNETNLTWGMERLYKIAFELFSHEYNLTNESMPLNIKNKNISSKEFHFLNLYYFRNTMGSHFNIDNNTNSLSSEEIFSYTQSMLYVMIFLVLKYHNELIDIFENNAQRQLIKAFDIKAYTNSIVCDYKKSQVFEYLDTKWDFDIDNSNGMTIMQIINEDYSRRIVAFIGEAGTGKTTALKRLEYEYAKKCSKNSFKGLPIYIELKNLRASNTPLVNAIASRFGLSNNDARNVVYNEPIILLLDGFNEISNKQFAASVKAEVEEILDTNNRILLFITDRTNKHTLLKVVQTTYFCFLHELSMEEKDSFFKTNSKSTTTYEIIKHQIDEELSGNGKLIIQNLKTPYMLSVILSYVDEYNSIPENPIKNYLDKLFEREEKEQKDSDDPKHFEKMKLVLAAIACKYEGNSFRNLDAQWVIGRIKDVFGYKDLDSVECIELSIKMGLFERNNNNLLQFKTKEICDYFYFYALNEGLDEYINEINHES